MACIPRPRTQSDWLRFWAIAALEVAFILLVVICAASPRHFSLVTVRDDAGLVQNIVASLLDTLVAAASFPRIWIGPIYMCALTESSSIVCRNHFTIARDLVSTRVMMKAVSDTIDDAVAAGIDVQEVSMTPSPTSFVLSDAVRDIGGALHGLATVPLAAGIAGLVIFHLGYSYLRRERRISSTSLILASSIVAASFIALALSFTIAVLANAANITFDDVVLKDPTVVLGGGGIALIFALLLSFVTAGLNWRVHKLDVKPAVLPQVVPKLEPRIEPPPFQQVVSVVSIDRDEVEASIGDPKR